VEVLYQTCERQQAANPDRDGKTAKIGGIIFSGLLRIRCGDRETSARSTHNSA